MKRLALIASLALPLAACQQDAEEPSADPVSELEAAATEEPETGAGEAEEGEPKTEDGEKTEDGVTFSYSKLDFDACDQIDAAEEGEGEWAIWECPAVQGVPYWVAAGDGRYDLDVGAEGEFETIGAFNDIAPTMEWRSEGGKPFAVIFRYKDVSMESGGRTVLAVEKVGSGGEAGCRVAQIEGSYPSANEEARKLADAEARGFTCGSDEPTFLGNAR
ncbi:hypothetical protein ACFCW2_04455 [Qipengyuania sp. DSG2-2]|uniref:hypothetical protein n=1 Tax=Qipengyuania sp. DGS2-2 TaxID=3349631 RepID=UPI0036D3F0BC